ncbi:MAG: winged helix-turn-helix domain-containing protein [Eggerthella lenta]
MCEDSARDDEPRIARVVRDMVEGADWHPLPTTAPMRGRRRPRDARLIIMDVMMPKMDGLPPAANCAPGVSPYVIFLSAKGDIVDKGVGFQAGGDDYMVKPFDPRELLMHIEAHLRRASMAAAPVAPRGDILHAGRFVLDRGQFRVTKDGERLSLTPKEFKIFFALASSPGLVLSKEQLVEAAWGKEFVGETSSITVFIKKLREKVEDDPSDPRVIQTVWGIGYRFEPEGREG